MENVVMNVIRMVLHTASPEIVELIRKSVQDLKSQAEATPNPWDDMLAGMLQLLVGKPGEER